MKKNYYELIKIKDYIQRYEYLKCNGIVGDETFGSQRMLNQILYQTSEWKNVIRPHVLARDMGYDMGHRDYPIKGKIIVHHINPITIEDIYNRNPEVFDLQYLISVSEETHNAIHYGDQKLLHSKIYKPRTPYDTCPWKGLEK